MPKRHNAGGCKCCAPFECPPTTLLTLYLTSSQGTVPLTWNAPSYPNVWSGCQSNIVAQAAVITLVGANCDCTSVVSNAKVAVIFTVACPSGTSLNVVEHWGFFICVPGGVAERLAVPSHCPGEPPDPNEPTSGCSANPDVANGSPQLVSLPSSGTFPTVGVNGSPTPIPGSYTISS
jgi:hypothetical protein